MTDAFDERLVQVGISIDGELILLEGLDIRAQGTKMSSPSAGQCTLRISNLTASQRNYILTKATPLQVVGQPRQPIYVTLDIGRQSYGLSRLFEGACWALGATSPPDIGITLQSLTNNQALGFISSVSYAAVTPLSTIAKRIADDNGLTLEFRAEDKNIANYSFSGALGKQVKKLAEMGNVNAYVDNSTLVVIAPNTYRYDEAILINASRGMVSIPQADMGGVTVTVLATPEIKLGSKVRIESEINPAINGEYGVWSIGFNIANRDNPFFYTLYCRNYALFGGVQ